MKAKVKKEVLIEHYGTLAVGTEIDVIDGFCACDGYKYQGVLDNGMRFYIDEKSIEITDYLPYVDWEHRRYELAKASMQGLLNATSVERFTLRIKPSTIADASIEYADAIIEKLKKKPWI